MKRLIVTGLALFALASAGCFAQADDTQEPGSAPAENDVRAGRVMTVDSHGRVDPSGGFDLHPDGEKEDGTNAGPQPDPWRDQRADQGDPNGPQPDPWHPTARTTNQTPSTAANNK